MTDDPEIWKPVSGYEGIYEISSLGRFAAIRNGERFLRKINKATSYRSVSLKKREQDERQKVGYIHVMVAKAFLGDRPSGHVVRHKDGNKYNNSVHNLCYGTPFENKEDDVRNEIHKGERNGNSKLNEVAVKAIKLLFTHNISEAEIARHLGVTQAAIRAIKIGRNWPHVTLD